MAYCSKCGAQLNPDSQFCNSCGAKTDAQSTSLDTNNDTNLLMGVLAYLSWLVIIPIVCYPNSQFIRFHCNQGLVLSICSTVWSAISGVLSFILFPLGLLFWVVNVFFVVLIVLGIINVCNGKMVALPVIGSIRILN